MTKIKNLSTFVIMNSRFWQQLILLFALFGFIRNVQAIPAPHKLIAISQPDGTVLNAWLKGDEFFHYAQSTDGYILLPDNNGFYTYAEYDATGALRAGKRIAVNVEKRTDSDRLFLKTIKPGLSFSESQLSNAYSKKIQYASINKTSLRSANATNPGLINDYPTTGSPKSLVILVNFSNLNFYSSNNSTTFSSMLNDVNYKLNGHVGSSHDYYKYNSGGLFSPDFVVVGPVTLPQTMEYYGSNDSKGNDQHAAKMIYDACVLAANSVDFSNFDYDNDGNVDNVYVFYAGKGEADGGSANTIWPHSWSLSGDGLSLTLNGKTINKYACSAELNGSNLRSGIGTFTHEYGHVLGLPDMYDVDYDKYNGQGFDLGEWSLMAYGAYNGNGCVPPSFTLLERKLLGWATPVALNSAKSMTLSDLGSSNEGFVINTNNTGEYFLLENRQNTSNPWDYYLPYHGMLIYHIDMRTDVMTNINYYETPLTFSYSDLWALNMVNAVASHQCADIVEADNLQTVYTGNSTTYLNSLKGDPFPGLQNIQSFTYETVPSMRTWNGMDLNESITSISENNEKIKFDFKVGGDIKSSPVSLSPKEIKPFQFSAYWTSVDHAVGYYLDVYTKDTLSGDTIKNFVSGYENLFVKDTLSIVNVPKDLTTYYYCVRATNNLMITPNSNIVNLTTTDGTPKALAATGVQVFSFTANWKPVKWATGYYFNLYTLNSTAEGDTTVKYMDGYENKYTADSTLTINNLNDKTTYFYKIQATTGFAMTNYSNVISLTTADGTPVALPATNIKNFSFNANWKSQKWAEGYYFDLYTLDITAAGDTLIHYIDGFKNKFVEDSTMFISELDDQTSYYYRIRATIGGKTTRNSNVSSLTTPKASAILTNVKNGIINMKRVDPGSLIQVYDLNGILRYTSSTNKIKVDKTGIYIIEAMFNGKRQTVKVLVDARSATAL